MQLRVISKKLELNDVFSLILEKPKDFNFYPGQYLDIELPVQDRNGNTRAYTISSSPTEDFLMITTKKGVSQFKKALEESKKGDSITTSHPAGTFTLDESTPAVFIAGGIGITPFRSIIKYALDQNLNTPITLFYSNSDNNFLFKKELGRWQRKLPNLTIHYLDTSKHKRLNRVTLQQILNFPLSIVNYIYYLAGPPTMVDEFEKILLSLGIDQISIRYDRFDGY